MKESYQYEVLLPEIRIKSTAMFCEDSSFRGVSMETSSFGKLEASPYECLDCKDRRDIDLHCG